jgi:hypothetical protein
MNEKLDLSVGGLEGADDADDAVDGDTTGEKELAICEFAPLLLLLLLRLRL